MPLHADLPTLPEDATVDKANADFCFYASFLSCSSSTFPLTVLLADAGPSCPCLLPCFPLSVLSVCLVGPW